MARQAASTTDPPRSRRIGPPIRALAGIALALGLSAPVAATTPGSPGATAAASPALLTAAMAWVAAVTDLPLPAQPPTVAFSDPAAMAALRGGDGAAPGHAGAESIVALYDTTTRTIHLPPGWTGASPAEMSILVHELVHHMQTVAARPHACAAERERAAYAAQARWLELFGGDLATAFEIDPLTLLVLTTCGL